MQSTSTRGLFEIAFLGSPPLLLMMGIQKALKLVQHSNNPKFAVQICAPYSSLYFVILSPSYSCYPLLSVIQLIKRQSSLSTHLVEIYCRGLLSVAFYKIITALKRHMTCYNLNLYSVFLPMSETCKQLNRNKFQNCLKVILTFNED